MIARPARAPRALLSSGLLILTLVLLSASISAVAGDLRLLVVCAAGLLSGAALLWPEKVALGLLFVLFTRLSDNYRPAEWALSLNQLAIAACLPAIPVRRLLGWQSTL